MAISHLFQILQVYIQITVCNVLRKEKSTSIHVSGQGHKLDELVSREEGADFIGRPSLWAHVEVTNDEGGFLKVDELLQEMCSPEQRFLLGAIHGDDIQIIKGDFPKLNVGLADVVVAEAGRLVLHINSNAFSSASFSMSKGMVIAIQYLDIMILIGPSFSQKYYVVL